MIIDLPWPSKELWPNGGDRNHPAKIARLKKKHREWAYLCALEVKPKQFKHDGGKIPVTLYIYAKPKGPYPDADNCIAAMKSSFDGIADALGINDRDFLAPAVIYAEPREGRVAVRLFHSSTEQNFEQAASQLAGGDVTGGSA